MDICNTVAGSRRLEAVCHIKGEPSRLLWYSVPGFFLPIINRRQLPEWHNAARMWNALLCVVVPRKLVLLSAYKVTIVEESASAMCVRGFVREIISTVICKRFRS